VIEPHPVIELVEIRVSTGSTAEVMALPAWQAVPVRRTSRILVTAAAGLLALGLTGCKGNDEPSSDQSPTDRLSAAKGSVDDAEYIGFTLSTESLPDDLDGLLSATGTGTHDPAFTGEVKVQTAIDITAPVIAVDGKVYAKLPFSSYAEIDPGQYGAPDPADLMDSESGISSLFPETEGAAEGDSKRDGDTVLTEITGTLPGEAVKGVFPSAGAEDFDVTYTLTDDDVLDSATITGPFYDGYDDVTYKLSLDLDADPVEIEAP
jgi:lipoprotein LprG